MSKVKILFTWIKQVRFPIHVLRKNNFNRFISKPREILFKTNYGKYNQLPIPVVLLSLVSFWSSKEQISQMTSNEKEPEVKTLAGAIKNADEVFTANKHEEVCNILSEYKDSGDVEVLWRLARSKFKLSSQSDIAKDVKEKAIIDGFDIITKALEIDPKHYAVHKWMSVLLDARSELIGMKERITQLQKVKEHMLEAVKLNPNDATTYHMLGSWCYQIADMAWYQRKIASTLFASPPTSTFQEALQYFKQAEEVQPNFYSQNLLMLGKTYFKLGEHERAYYYLKLTTEYLASSDDDLMAHKEANTLLENKCFASYKK